MSKEIKNRIAYTVMCISEFAQKYSMQTKQAYLYLKQHGGISFLKDCYDAEHLLSIDDAIDDLALICRKNGGNVA